MEVHFKQETETKLNKLAQRTHRGADELLDEVVEHVAFNERFERKVKDRQAAVASGEPVPAMKKFAPGWQGRECR